MRNTRKIRKSMVFALVLMLIFISMLAVGCDNKNGAEFSLQEMMEKGKSENLLSVYNSYQIKITTDGSEAIIYCTNDTVYMEYQDSTELYYKNELKYANVDGKNSAVLFVDMEPYCVLDEGEESLIYSEATVNEEVISSENKDGKLYVRTRMPKEEMEDTLLSFGIEYTEGDSVEVLYVLEENTLHLLESTIILISEGAEDYVVMEASVEYNTKIPELCKELVGYLEQTENLRQVNIVADADTSKEQKWSLQCPKGVETMVYIGEEFDGQLYANKECTVSVEVDAQKDVLAYLKRID